MSERERFENWWGRNFGNYYPPDSTFDTRRNEGKGLAWRAWQARVPECEWAVDNDGIWHTSCDNAWVFDAGDPTDNKCKFCPYCGGSLIQAAPEPE